MRTTDMAAYAATIRAVEELLARAEDELATWQDAAPEVRAHRPAQGGWTIDEILEHLALANHFLLLVIEKHAGRARSRAARLGLPAEGESDLARLRIDRERQRSWSSPAHMLPSGQPSPAEVRARLAEQLMRARAVLASLEGGAGSLARMRMSVAELGPLDLYQWLAFLALHVLRHAEQMRANARPEAEADRPNAG